MRHGMEHDAVFSKRRSGNKFDVHSKIFGRFPNKNFTPFKIKKIGTLFLFSHLIQNFDNSLSSSSLEGWIGIWRS